jgi:hypothetical protein
MVGWRTALFALLVLAVIVLADWRFQTSSENTASNADLVYCLAPDHHVGLVDAAESLGFASGGSTPAAMHVPGSTITLSTWRADDDAKFNQACAAYAASSVESADSADSTDGGGPIGSLFNILLPVAVGALLAFAFDEFKQGSDRRWEQADALRDSWAAYRALVETYLAKRQEWPVAGLPAQGDIDARRGDLADKLRTIQSQYRRSRTLATLKRDLSGALGDGIDTGWASGSTTVNFTERKSRADALTGTLDNFDSSLQRVAVKLSRGIWLTWRL